MFSVYKITNKINGKIYIGSSIRVEKRWQQHINASKNMNSNSYNYPLQKAFRKYGIDNFIFEVIKDDFETQLEMLEYEKDMIIKTNSFNSGYNQTVETIKSEIAKENLEKRLNKNRCSCAKVDKQNNILEIYPSYHEAARKNGLNGEAWASTIRNICKGKISSIKNELFFRDLDNEGNIIITPFKTHKGKKAVVGIHIETQEEIYFDSISAAAKALATDRWSITQCIQGITKYSNVKKYIFSELDINGEIVEVENNTIENIIEKYNQTNPIINGERHNIKEWCKIYNISGPSYYNRLKKGMSVVEALTTPKGR